MAYKFAKHSDLAQLYWFRPHTSPVHNKTQKEMYDTDVS